MPESIALNVPDLCLLRRLVEAERSRVADNFYPDWEDCLTMLTQLDDRLAVLQRLLASKTSNALIKAFNASKASNARPKA